MSAFEIVAIVLAGLAAGTINTIVGSGTLITFPTLLFFGHPPVTANISNSLGLVPGGVTGAWGYRREMDRLGPMLLRLAPASLVGAITGALLLLVLPAEAFETIVPVLILLALVLVVTGPRLQRWAASTSTSQVGRLTPGRWVALILGILATGVYGGYFGAAQGVLLLGIMSILLPHSLQQINGIKNVLGLIANLVAALVFLVVAPQLVDWMIVLLISCGSLVGGVIGARVGRRMPPALLRGVILVIGSIAIINLVVT